MILIVLIKSKKKSKQKAVSKSLEGIIFGPKNGKKRKAKDGHLYYCHVKGLSEIIHLAKQEHQRLGLMTDGKNIHERGNVMGIISGYVSLIESKRVPNNDLDHAKCVLEDAVKRARKII